ncbi:MAG: transporter substrate-binding domain-containing protein, partial [Desulfobacteraceae bacterium]|nr:transporter substrate-binding domain-containing protein [Desulfobacteraceae bacterium]
MKSLKIFVVCCSIIMILYGKSIANDMFIGTNGKSPPTGFMDENGELTGLTTDLVFEIQKRVGNTNKIAVYPWARIYLMALNKPNVVIFTASRNADRENKFHW